MVIISIITPIDPGNKSPVTRSKIHVITKDYIERETNFTNTRIISCYLILSHVILCYLMLSYVSNTLLNSIFFDYNPTYYVFRILIFIEPILTVTIVNELKKMKIKRSFIVKDQQICEM